MVRGWVIVSVLALAFSTACASTDVGVGCQPSDQDGVVGGTTTVLLSVSDTDFSVGGVNSGSTQSNIAVQNSSTVRLTATNVGSSAHSLVVDCIPSDLPAGCPAMSCFPSDANIPALEPRQSITVTFTTPAVEGAYRFTSTEPGDTATDTDGNVTGLVGQFVLL